MPNGYLRQANLKMLFERAKQYESASFKGLYNFIQFIDKIKISSGDLGAAKVIGENEDVVRIMSIHKSKGLEFPVVFLSGTGKQFNLMDLNNNILLHQEMGIGFKYIDYDKQVQYDTMTKKALKGQMFKETLSEEMRILYVGLTRAKEKLIITGTINDYDKQIQKIQEQVNIYTKESDKINPILVKKYKKYLDWILLVYLYEKDSFDSFCNLTVFSKDDLLEELKSKDCRDENNSVLEKLNDYIIDNKKIEEIEKELNKKYKYLNSINIPTKTSVTKIKQMKSKTEDKIDYDFGVPDFMKKEEETILTGAQKGTLIHLCMQRLDTKIDYDKEKLKELINNMELSGIINKKEADSININAILRFVNSNIWNRVKTAKKIYKEKPFYYNISAKDIYNDESNEEILIQGIIDLYFIDKDDKLVLLDYKTDYVLDEKELINKYIEQLDLYKKSLESALNKKVDEIYIYSTYLGKEIPIII